ncbi:halocyanin domain-containing protein [Haloplanus rubicundus]|uniref:Halocyanin domain-containing protein n=1 Tax=Haloplanus rubicundus TaxID=1547898 RepID=A0A345EHS6_9EURY|nr:halocyanin domain-containing protein [Haloplanus rubicundus]AXG11748.1 halocyanin domain-containing protein [Haloplanus rubicundus]
MFESKRCTRRSVVLSTGTLALTALAGCSGGGGGGSESDGGGGESQSDGGTATETESGDGGGGSGGGTPSFDGWMENVGNYDGVVDETGGDEVTVAVGAEGNGGAYAFGPPAVRVSSGTTVVWEWTGQGAQHNVAAESGGFESDLSAEEGFTFEHTFSESGTYTYVCTPHRTLGMKGVVVVE